MLGELGKKITFGPKSIQKKKKKKKNQEEREEVNNNKTIMPENIQRVKKITLTEKIQVKEKIDEEEIIKIREKVSAEINQLNQELVSEVADAENIKKIVNELTDLKEVDEFRKLYLKTIITNYLERVGGDYKAFLVRKDIIEEAEVVAILLHNQQLFIEISLNRQTTNSSIADVMAEIYQEKKRVIDQSINDLTLVKKGLIPKLQSEVFSLIEKIIALEQKLESQSAQLTQSGIFLQLAKEEIERLYKENGELYVELDKFSEAREKFAEFEWQLENQKEQIASFQEQLRNKDLVIEDKEKAISRLEEQLARTETEGEKEQRAIATKALEALNLFKANQKELERLKSELRKKEKELAVKEAEINQLTQEIAAKNETITSLRKRIEDLTSRKVKKDQKEQAAIIISLGKQIEVQKEQITEAENHRERAAREKQALAEEVENLRQQSEELIKLVEKDFQTFSEQLTGLQAISRKYEEMLACLGVTEENLANARENPQTFWEELLGKNVKGEIPTLFDIKKISGIGSLQDLIDEVEKLRSEVSELTESQEPTGERSLADELSTASQLTEESIKAKLSTGFLKATEEIVELTGAEIATAKKKTEDLEKDLKEFADRTGYSLEALKYLSFTENYSLRQLIDSHAAGWQLIETQMDPTGKLFPEFGESRRKKIYEKAAEKLKKFPQLEEAFVKMEKIFRDFIEQVIEKADIELNEQTYDRNENQTNLDTHQRVCDAILGKLEAKLREKSGSQENGEKQLEKLKENNADLQKTNQLLKWTTGIGALVSLVSIGINWFRKPKLVKPKKSWNGPPPPPPANN